MRKTVSRWAATALVLGLAGPALAADWKPESEAPIKLAINEWTGQNLTTYIGGQILAKMGYNVEYVVAGYYPQMVALESGDVTASLEIWTTNIGDAYDKALATGKVVDIGSLGVKPVETWYYAGYMEEQCPGLPDWTALKECGELFATAETMPDGRFVDYPADWGPNNDLRIKALGLPFVAIPSGSEGSLVAEIKNAFDKKLPLLAMWYKPHWVYGVYDLRELKLPPYEEGCFDKPEIGLNPDAAYDCDFKRGDVRKVAWVDMAKTWPAATKVLSALALNNDEQIDMVTKVDQGGKRMQDVAAEWVAANETTWSGWVNAAKQ